MNLHVKIDPDKLNTVTANDDGPSIVRLTLAQLSARKWLIGVVTLVGMSAVSVGLWLTPSLYTSKASLELNFNREAASANTATWQLASMDPGALVNGAAEEIGSRANAGRVVTRLGLDQHSSSNAPSFLGGLLTDARQAIGLGKPPLPARELAIDEVQSNLLVTYQAHAYVVGISYTDKNPETAAKVANALVIEHLRGERLRELGEQRGSAVRELVNLSETLGSLHPKYALMHARIEHLDNEINAVGKADADPAKFQLPGQYLTLAEPIMIPTSPKRFPILALGFGASLGLGVLLALLAERLTKRFR